MFVVISNLKNKNRAERISYIRSFKKGKGAVIYIYSIPLFWIGYLSSGQNAINSLFYAIRKSVELVVLRYDIAPVQSVMESNQLYCAAIYLCYTLVCINAILFIISLANQHLWHYCKEIQFKYSRKDKIILFGNNKYNHSIYLSDSNRQKIIIAHISNDDAQSLYMKNMLYRDETSLSTYIEYIIKRSIKNNNEKIVIINTGDDVSNLEICQIFKNGIMKLNEDDRLTCFCRLKIFTFGDPEYESIYEDIVSNSLGCISYINKYKRIAVDIIEKYPFSLFLSEHHVDYTTSCLNSEVEINALLIGFGKTNRQFFLTSVANNQFITNTDSDIGLKKVNYHLFDRDFISNNKKLNHNYNRYKNEFVDIDINVHDYLPLPTQPANTFFYKLDVNDIEFYKNIREIVSDKNSVSYVIIAFGSDLENIDMAKKILCKFREWVIKDFTVFVKVRNDYNEIHNIEDDHCFIVGNEKLSVYNIKSILADHLSKMAQMRDVVYEIEREIVQDTKSVNLKKIEYIKNQAYKDWYMRKTQLDRESCVYCCLSLRSKLNLMGLDYCHIDDERKPALSEQEYLDIYALNDIPDKSYYNLLADGKPIIHYPLDFKKSLRRNFAIQEHLRWNSFMISKGVVPASRKQILTEVNSVGQYTNGKNLNQRRHGCLTTFNGLLEYRRIIANRDISVGETLQQVEIRKDVIKYDYQIMDDAHWLLTKCGYKIIRK